MTDAKCPGPLPNRRLKQWLCYFDKCPVNGDWRTCKATVEARGYALVQVERPTIVDEER